MVLPGKHAKKKGCHRKGCEEDAKQSVVKRVLMVTSVQSPSLRQAQRAGDHSVTGDWNLFFGIYLRFGF